MAERSRNAVQQLAVPLVLQDAPDALHGVVLAVVGGIVREAHGELVFVDEVDHTLDELGSSAVVLGTVVQVQDQSVDCIEARRILPPYRHPTPAQLRLSLALPTPPQVSNHRSHEHTPRAALEATGRVAQRIPNAIGR